MRDESCILACQSNFTSRELAETIFDILPVRHFPNSSVFTSCENSDFSAEQRLQKENQDNQPVLNSATTICNFPDISKNLDENLEHLSSTIQDLRNLSTIVQDVRNLSTAVQDLKNVTQDLRNLIESVQYLKKLINTVQDLKNVTEILQDAITQVQNVVSQSKATQAKSDYDIREGLGNVTNILADLTRHIKSLLFTAEPSQRTTSNDMITVLTEVKRLQKTVQDELIGTTSNYVYAILGLVILITATLVVSVIVNIIYIMKCYNKPMTEKKETATEDEDIPLTDVGDKTPAPDIDDRNIRGRVGHIH
ncbi:uncharacterized protein LOC131944251 [Physella acuta]|uniref:uncharacterized protein LOC131944251 n=1 Tax=Physella acuta TaxID=109671 RepID=UPI0027DE36D8|nr:uncharacterized protein LOC131944251 [Physella acuta]